MLPLAISLSSIVPECRSSVLWDPLQVTEWTEIPCHVVYGIVSSCSVSIHASIHPSLHPSCRAPVNTYVRTYMSACPEPTTVTEIEPIERFSRQWSFSNRRMGLLPRCKNASSRWDWTRSCVAAAYSGQGNGSWQVVAICMILVSARPGCRCGSHRSRTHQQPPPLV